MQHCTVGDVMTRDVVVAHPETTFKEIAALFHRRGITAVPVVDELDRPVGLVSEADLIRKEAGLLGEDHRSARWVHPHGPYLAGPALAEELMTSPVVTARADWSLVKTARVMDRRKLKRLPVIDQDGRLTGIVSRADVLRPFLREDASIRAEITHDILLETLWQPADAVDVSVEDGVVTLTGTVERKSLVPILERMCRSLDGVVAVRQTLGYETDDTRVDTAAQSAVRGIIGSHSAHHR
ncbi:CBS domain-containing protein [Kitasatospora paracochleata]|uniref:CBS domain-containing protein n=1 Tax=Kitasatospora paracochleata TaxID=58354 RepID=A0ABT1J7I0_9ACTN|nr:CBS domain-containing protein [Kitasatospora paracochleata]MCP2313392.1 CBS domain-containing protein [Kitasatospora paracochleata]